MSTVSPSNPDFDFPDLRLPTEDLLQVVQAPGLPSGHPLEPSVFARHEDIPAHRQEPLAAATVLQVGAGGLGSWTGLALVRSGVGSLTLVEPDRFDRSNASRQLLFDGDLGQPKAHRVAHNLAPHMVAGGQIVSIALGWEDGRKQFALAGDVVVCLVDNNECRLDVARFARQRRIPAIFTMLSGDGMRCQSFLQGPNAWDACLHCAKPDMDPERAMPCAAAIITSCMLAAAYTVFFTHRSICGWGDLPRFNWRQGDLTGIAEEGTGMVTQRPNCPTCGPLV